MANLFKLKAWVRYDGKGRLVGGGPIVQAHKPKNGDWVEIPFYEYCCQTTSTTTTQVPSLRLVLSSTEEMILRVGDPTDVSNWNTFFNLPTYGTPFTSVSVNGTTVNLYGGSNIILYDSVFDQGGFLHQIDDSLGCIVSTEYGVFYQNNALTLVNLPALTIVADSCFYQCSTLTSVNIPLATSIGDEAFYYCTSLPSISLPQATYLDNSCFEGCQMLSSVSAPLADFIGNRSFYGCYSLTGILLPLATVIGDVCFQGCTSLTSINLPVCAYLGSTVGNDNVFNNITGNNITLTIPSALMTCNSGSPDGDIQYLQTNNTVTIVTV